jgi:3,4-dihydroxy-2-butanone 4-phosphate synthase
MAGHNPLVPGSPDIDVHTKFILTENDKAGTLKVNAVQTGDAFPSAETMIGDTKGNQLFIGVRPANGNPYTSLPGDNDRPRMSANFTVTMDGKVVFTGVQQGEKKYTTAEWNKMNQNKPTVQQ